MAELNDESDRELNYDSNEALSESIRSEKDEFVTSDESPVSETCLVVPQIPQARPVKAYVLAVDLGSSRLRCHVCDINGKVKGASSRKIETLHPQLKHVEIDEKKLWSDFTQVIRETLNVASLSSNEISCLGITVQRGTFILWNRETGSPYHHFISWQDGRASELVDEWNGSYTIKAFRSAARLMHNVTSNRRYAAGKSFSFKMIHVTLRLLYMLDSIPQLRKDATEGKVMFGTIDSWLLWKLSGGKVHVTEYSCASSTGMFDANEMDWSAPLLKMVNIPLSILPKFCNTSGLLARTSPEILGSSIPITAMIADQQSALFAHGCYNPGDVKITLGTGTFIDVCTGSEVYESTHGMYPLVGWKCKDDMVYCMEAAASDTANLVEWAQRMQLFDDVNESARIASSVADSGGVYFIPAFSGLPSPVNNDTACTALLGITPTTTKAHVLRAVLESIVFLFKLVYEMALKETRISFNLLRVDGGVSNNDFVVQLMSDLTNQPVYRPDVTDQTILGATYLAGLGNGFWKSRKEIEFMKSGGRLFKPHQTWSQYRPVVVQWERAMRRTMNWYKYSPHQRHLLQE